MVKNVLVTGGAGYIGSHICKALSLKGYQPIALDNLSKGRADMVRWGPLIVGSTADRERVASTIQRFQPIAVIHLAALSEVGESVSHPDLYYQNNVTGTLNLLEILRQEGCDTVIFSSTCATYGEVEKSPIQESASQLPINPYGWSKLFSEQMIKDFRSAFGLRYALLRYFNVAGADLEGEIGESHTPPFHVIPILLDAAMYRKSFTLFGENYPTPDGTCIRDYIHVVDVANAHIEAMEHLLKQDEGLAINLGSGRGFSVKELIKTTELVTGKTISIQKVAKRVGDAAILVADNREAYRALGWSVQHSDLETIVSSAWKWHMKFTQMG